jgi:hypothetical protein
MFGGFGEEARVVHAPVSGEDSALLRRLGLNFLLDVFVYSLVSMYSCLCAAQVLL